LQAKSTAIDVQQENGGAGCDRRDAIGIGNSALFEALKRAPMEPILRCGTSDSVLQSCRAQQST
jgi:hypothetical protein